MSDEENHENRGKGRPRGKTGGNRGGKRQYQGQRSNYRNNRGKDYRRKGNKEKNQNNYNANFDRSNIKNDDYQEEEKEEVNYYNNNDNYYNNNNYNDNYNDNYNNSQSYKKNYSRNINNNYKQNQKKSFLSLNKIRELSQKEDINDLIMILHEDDNLYNEINNTNFKKESCYLLMNIIRKISEINSEPVLKIINKIIENTKFFQNIARNYMSGEEVIFDDDQYLDFSLDVIDFLNISFRKNSTSANIDLNINWCKTMIESILEDKNKDINDNKKEKMNEIINKINDYEKQKKIIEYEKYKKKNENNFQGNDKYYKNINVIINPKEFSLDKKYNIDSNKLKGPYESYEKYINTQFFLEYEDCYRSLRRAIKNLIEEGKSLNQLDKQEKWDFERRKHDIYCYSEGEIIKAEINHEGIQLTIDFVPILGKKIKFTRRMINGSLVIITDNNFKDYLLAVVSYNPYLEKKLLEKSEDKKRKRRLEAFNLPKEPRYRIKLELINVAPESFKFMINHRTNLQIFESRAYFQSYIHVLNRLKNMVIKELPFEKEIIKADFDDLLIKKDYKYGNNIISPIDNIFPQILKDKLDESQLEALKHCLTSKIALIQGPPGTGKTHVGSIVTNIIRENLKGKSKILVVCFTNHALDQFLENIIKDNNSYNIEENIVRIGGRCKNEIIKKFVLSSEKYKSSKYRDYERQLNQIGRDMANVTSLIDKTKRDIVDEVKKEFPSIYTKIINDFFKMLNISKKEDYIKKYPLSKSVLNDNKKGDTYKIKEDIIGNKIVHFWSFTGQKNFQISDLISNIFDDMELSNYNQIIDASGNFKDYANDNNNLINDLKNFEKNKKKLNISKSSQKIFNSEYSFDNDSDDSDEEGISFDFSDSKLDERFSDDDYLKEDDLSDDFNIFNSSVNYEGELSEMENEINLNDEKIEYLLNEENGINFFRIGQTLVKQIINYVKAKKLDNLICDEEKLKQYEEIMKKKKSLNIMIDLNTIKKKKIVAMTTTGCSKYSTIIEQSNFEVVIIEEAAEVLEPHILALLTKNTKRLIMIGDHKQLKPKPYSYELCKNYNFDVSMFERLINNNIKYVSLKYQRRMKPLFANFVRLIYGEDDYVDKGVEDREQIKGMVSDMFIVTHENLEKEKDGMKSKCNSYEARYLVKLCEYLIKQGYQDSQITILTFYIGQVMTILSEIKNSLTLNDKNIKVSSVDNYQGEENDIILLSLVRSNKDYNIGFLRTFNRVCVAFSRAKLGFYVIGNIDCIIKGINKLKKDRKDNNSLEENMLDVWQKIKDEAEKRKIIGNVLKLKCQNHGTITEIKKIEDFANCPEGGCMKKCTVIKKCGHHCEKACHNYNCKEEICTKICGKINPNCALLTHKCKKLCSKECGPCEEKVKIKLQCGHEIECECSKSKNPQKIKCLEPCNKLLKCGHQCKLKCYEDCESKPCMELIEKKLSCNHIQQVSCSIPDYEIICEEKCYETLPCGHQCSGTCGKCLGGTLHVKCKKPCEKNLICGHRCEERCASKCICYKQCPNRCPHGECGDLCCDICIDCADPCEIKCPHRQCENLCGEKCNVEPCNKRCKKKMKCKHQCMGLCGERCPNVCKICDPENECFEIFFGHEDEEDALFYMTECKHIIEYRDMDHYMESQRTISIPVCPKCKSQLIWEPRYQNYIREQLKNVQNVKKHYIELIEGKNEQFYKKTLEILSRIKTQYNENKILIFDSLDGVNIEKKNDQKNLLINAIIGNNQIIYERSDLNLKIPTIYNLMKKIEEKNSKDSAKKRSNSTYNLLTLAEKFMAIEYMKYIINKKNNNMSEDEKKFMRNFFVIKDYFSKFGDSFTYYFFNDLKIKIDNLLFYTILKLKPDILDSSEELMIDIVDSDFIKPNLELKSLYKDYINEKAIFILGNLGFIWYKCSKGHFYCGENNAQNKNEEIKCPVCSLQGKNIKKYKQVNFDKNIAKSIENNPLLNQDEEALNEMRFFNTLNNIGHGIDPDILLLMIEFPELNEYN